MNERLIMGVSTDGQLSFGVCFGGHFEFPWSTDKYDGDIDKWWQDVRGFVNPIESPFNEHGNYKPGINRDSPVISEYFAKKREWENANPIPVEVVNYCSDECPMYMLSTKGISNKRGYPEKVDIDFLRDTEEARQVLREFMDQYGIESDDDACWWLSSYYG